MTNKELILDFFNYCKPWQVLPVLKEDIESIAEEYVQQQNLQQCSVSGSLPDEVTIKAQARDYAKTSDDDSSYNVQKKQAFEAGVKWLADLLMNDVRQ